MDAAADAGESTLAVTHAVANTLAVAVRGKWPRRTVGVGICSWVYYKEP